MEKDHERSFRRLSVRYQPFVSATRMQYSAATSRCVCGALGAMVLQQGDDGVSPGTRLPSVAHGE